MKNKFEYTPLGKIAQIDISGVDKKTKENERQVRLCNFVDVYHNWAITQDLYENFMIASANEREIDLFKIKKGQVAITKDSETRDDIGISTYIADDFNDVILGYHTALITPNEKFLNGKFLNAFLHTSTAKKHFENNASGSGQRYTLTNDAISSIKVPLCDIEIQEKIGNLFSLIDKKIKNNNRIYKILAKFTETIYDYWFLQFNFSNKEGRPYKFSEGKMIYNEKLKKEIPESWEIKTLSQISNMYQPTTFDAKLLEDDGLYRVYGAGGYMGQYHEYNHKEQEIFISCRGSCGQIYKSMPKSMITGNAMIVHPNDNRLMNYLYLTLSKYGVKQCITGSVQYQITRDSLNDWSLVMPPMEILNDFNSIVRPASLKINNIIEENQKLEKLRDFLLPLLMNGQVTIKEAEEKVDQAIKEENITIFPNYDFRFELWLQNQGLAARGDIDRKTLREIFDAMDDNDK